MIRLLLIFALAALPLYPQNPATAAFPTTVAVDQNLLAAKRLSESTLNGSINASTTTVVVSDGTQFLNWQIIRIDSEEMLIQSVSSNTLTIVSGGRGYNGTTAASHTTGAAVRGIITSWHHNQLAAEVKAIETRLRNVTGQCVDAGSTDDYACSPAPPFTSYATGMIVNFKAATANTGAATVNFNSIGAGAIKKVAGGVTTALDTNDIRAGQWVTVVYDGTNFQMISALGNAGSSGGSGVSSCVPTSASGTTYTCTASPAIGSLTTGLVIAFKPDVGSSGSATLNVSGSGAIALYKTLPTSTVQIGNGDLIADVEYLVIYSGTYWYILGVANAAYNYIMEEGSALTQRTVLNMIGAGVTCADNAGSGRTECTITADAVKSGSNTWSGANDFSGATSFVVRFGTTAPASGDCDAAGERGNLYVRTGDPATIATRVSVCTQTGASTYAWNPISHKVGTTAPATCVIGEIFFDSDATAGSNWLGCTATDTWTTQGSGSGGAPTGAQYLTLATDATLTAERVLTPDANMSVSDAGAGGAYTFGPDTAKILSRATAQAGALRVASSTGSDTYTGTATPTLTTYTDGMVVEFEATATANTGAASLNIDTLGAVNIKLCDGSTDPATGDIAVGKQVPLRYDGTVFRLPCNPATVSAGSSTGTARHYFKAGQSTIGGGYALGAGISAAPSTVAALANLGDSWGGGFYLPKTAGNGVVLHHMLSDWTGSGNITLSTGWMWDGGGGGSGVWRIAVAAICVATGDAQVAIGSWNVVEATSSSQTNADRVKLDSINIDTTGCAAGETLFLHLYRNGADGGDATTTTARIAFLELSYAKNL